nr:cytospin-A [Macaca nemestrina]
MDRKRVRARLPRGQHQGSVSQVKAKLPSRVLGGLSARKRFSILLTSRACVERRNLVALAWEYGGSKHNAVLKWYQKTEGYVARPVFFYEGLQLIK